MIYVTKIMDFMYYMITEIISNTLFQYFLYMIILLFIIRTVRYMICW